MSFEFNAFREPFPNWHGPYSPATGVNSGFRVRHGFLMTVVHTDNGQESWLVQQTNGVRSLQYLVRERWGGGRVLLLPNGLVVKPSPNANAERWAIGRIHGPVVLEKPDGTIFSLAAPGHLRSGDRWPGPSTTGLACVIDARTGALKAQNQAPTANGFLVTTFNVWPSDRNLARGFAIARPGENGGRVRVTANGHVITNRQRFGQWECVYVGQIDVTAWPHLAEWAEGVELSPPYHLDIDAIEDAIHEIEEIEEILDDADDDSTDSFADAPSDGDDCDPDDATWDEESGEGTTADSFFERLDENEAPYEDDEYDEDFIEEDEEIEEETE